MGCYIFFELTVSSFGIVSVMFEDVLLPVHMSTGHKFLSTPSVTTSLPNYYRSKPVMIGYTFVPVG